ncbi:MAG: cell division protein ZapA [Cyclobacteriaceae bacterium]|jgi:cell division protein ZapA
MTELSIKIRIGNREYPMRVKAEDEERIRRAGKILNEKMKTYKEKFGIEDQQDLLAMVAFDCQVDKMKNEESLITTDEHSLNQVIQLNQLISQAI